MRRNCGTKYVLILGRYYSSSKTTREFETFVMNNRTADNNLTYEKYSKLEV